MNDRIATERLVLEPVTEAGAREIVAGSLEGLVAGPGWPHADTLDGLRMVRNGGAEVWLVLAGGAVVGDAGTHGPPDEDGAVEIGFGLAAPSRGRGYASEFLPALCRHLLARPDVRRVHATTAAGNVASRRVLEKTGFRLEREDLGLARYSLG